MYFAPLLLVSTVLPLVYSKATIHDKNEFAKRQAAKIQDALIPIATQLGALDDLVTAFNGNPSTGALDALKIQAQADHLGKAVLAATNVAEASPNLNDKESLDIATLILGVVPSVESLLKKIVSKKSAFQNVVIGLFDVTGRVQATLINQKGLTLALGHTIAEKFSRVTKDAAPAVLDELEADFDRAIAAFGA